jgi:hypothetical protein
MITIGDKNRFAFEIKVDELYYDNFIASGRFLVYANGTPYGLNEPYATYFMCVDSQINEFCNQKTNADLHLEKYSKDEIATSYYCQYFSDCDLSNFDDNLLKKTKQLAEWSPESAFDDGTHLIHFDNENNTRIIIFKSCSIDNACMVQPGSVEEVTISREEFLSILVEAHRYFTSLKNKSENEP